GVIGLSRQTRSEGTVDPCVIPFPHMVVGDAIDMDRMRARGIVHFFRDRRTVRRLQEYDRHGLSRLETRLVVFALGIGLGWIGIPVRHAAASCCWRRSCATV